MFFTGGLTKADSSAAKQYRTMKATPRVALDYRKKREKKTKKLRSICAVPDVLNDGSLRVTRSRP